MDILSLLLNGRVPTILTILVLLIWWQARTRVIGFGQI